jgi:carbon monoxide dehydrogenase subunit G
MVLRLEHAFRIKARVRQVWAFLTDPLRVARALPGAAITGTEGDVDHPIWNGTITVKFGPVAARYRGTLRFEAVDAAAYTATMVAQGRDVSGHGGAEMRTESCLTETAGGETEVVVASEVSVAGLLAQLGRGLVQDLWDEMVHRFTEAARVELEQPGDDGAAVAVPPPAEAGDDGSVAAAPADGSSPPLEIVSLGTKIIARAIVRAIRRPMFWILAFGTAGVFYWFSIR